MDGLYFVCLDVVDAQQGAIWLVVAQKHFIFLEIDGLSSNIVAKESLDRSLDADVPEVNCAVPSSAEQDVGIKGVPL